MKLSSVLCGLMVSLLHWHAQASTVPVPSGQPAPSRLEELRRRLITAEEEGVRYVKDDLTERSLYPVPLLVHTTLADPANCGRRAGGWTVKGGIADAYTYAVLRDLPVLGNRSQLAQLSFRSTQTGVAPGAHGLVEMRLCRGTTSDDLPLRIRVEDGRFYILLLNGDTVLAGDREKPAFTMSANTVYTLTVLLFEKGVSARLTSAELPGGALEIGVSDRYRFIPGRPGFGLRPNAQATGGDLAVFDWTVTAVAPASHRRLAAMGDSITAGSDREPEAESYVAVATRALGQDLIFNAGSGGSTTALDLGRFPYEIAPFRPEIVWIEGGTNDIGAGLSADVIFQNMQRQAELVTWGGTAVFSTVPPRPLPSPAHEAERARLNRLIRESGRPVVDRHALVCDPADPRQIRAEYRHADGIHLTRPGHLRIGEEAARIFKTLPTVAPPPTNAPQTLVADPRVRLTFGGERRVIEGGLQPSMVITRTGAIVVQSQLPVKPFPSKRIVYHSAMETVISRDQGATWTRRPLQPGDNGLNMEGGAVQLRDGSILALDTFVTPGERDGTGEGHLYYSTDDWRTLQGPVKITFDLPGVNFHGSTDDGGTPHAALRLHRRILELPNGDLLTTIYGWFKGDNEPTGYMPTMHKTRVVLVRSTNRGRHWTMVSTVAADRSVGTEGFGEAVLARINHGPHIGRLICQMRTGREQRETISDDEGRTWKPAYPRVYADLDVYRTEKWAEMFREVRDKHGRLITDNPVELIGAVVDPDLLELRSGVLVASFGVRIPPRACWPRAEHPWNGNYLAISLDHGATWSHVVRMTSGVLTTHYTAIEETPRDNHIFFAYDLGDWGSGRGRSTHGRTVEIAVDE